MVLTESSPLHPGLSRQQPAPTLHLSCQPLAQPLGAQPAPVAKS
jgi:hypothetical protein